MEPVKSIKKTTCRKSSTNRPQTKQMERACKKILC